MDETYAVEILNENCDLINELTLVSVNKEEAEHLARTAADYNRDGAVLNIWKDNNNCLSKKRYHDRTKETVYFEKVPSYNYYSTESAKALDRLNAEKDITKVIVIEEDGKEELTQFFRDYNKECEFIPMTLDKYKKYLEVSPENHYIICSYSNGLHLPRLKD